jgi:hypothetical protein
VAAVAPISPRRDETTDAAIDFIKRHVAATMARVANGWSMNADTMGVYGNYYLKRAIVAQVGLGANLPEDAIYPLNLADDTGRRLDGANKYTLHFDKGGRPPANAFWSITLYDSEGFQVANPPTDRSIFISRTKVPARTKKSTGFRHRKVPSI